MKIETVKQNAYSPLGYQGDKSFKIEAAVLSRKPKHCGKITWNSKDYEY